MDIEDMAAAVAKWASTQPLVRKAYLFGSRVRGTHRPDSDLDVAIELSTLSGDDSPLTTWICEAQELKSSIVGVCPVIIDLNWYGSAGETPYVHAGLEALCIVVYDADHITPTIQKN
jgi:predicted nucleotidyltransferase